MIQRVLNSKDFLTALLTLGTGTLLYFKMPWPATAGLVANTWNGFFLRLLAIHDPWTYAGLKGAYHVMLFTTPYIGFSFLLSAFYIFTLRPRRAGKPQSLPPYPAVESRSSLSLVIGEIHHPRLPIPADKPIWLTIPERDLFTGTIIIGAVGSGKTSCCMYPFSDQLLGLLAHIITKLNFFTHSCPRIPSPDSIRSAMFALIFVFQYSHAVARHPVRSGHAVCSPVIREMPCQLQTGTLRHHGLTDRRLR